MVSLLRVRIGSGVGHGILPLDIGVTPTMGPLDHTSPESVCDSALKDPEAQSPEILFDQFGLRRNLHPFQQIGGGLLREIGMQMSNRPVAQMQPSSPLRNQGGNLIGEVEGCFVRHGGVADGKAEP